MARWPSYGWGLRPSTSIRCASNRVARERTATSNPSPARCGMNCWTREIFYTLTEAHVLIERWRREYHTGRPHSALGYRPPAPEAVRPVSIGGCNGFNMSAALS